MKKLFLSLLLSSFLVPMTAQRTVDQLDRGLIAVPATGGGTLVSWRLLGEEYYDVTYNLYCDGTLLAENLSVTNYRHAEGNLSNQYQVAPVVKGVEMEKCSPVTRWSASYKEITLTHEGILSTLVPNDACCADVDGDGELEILMKFDNLSEMSQSYPKEGPVVNGQNTHEYSIFECLKLDGTRLWWVNCGPNMGDFQNNEQNIVGYDWDLDGKAEVVMRLLEGSSIHYADGTVYTIGANGQNGGSWYNFRGATGGGTNWFMHDGKEFLVYCNGETGQIYDIIDYPLARLEPGENDLNAAWGDGYGHRCSKFFFGAPYLDGRKPSIFLARGIYTQIKMCALDPNPSTHKLVKRWDWRQTSGGYWMWQGYHNFGVADVDEDGRDEIVYGSMVIDDNGKGLSTTGLGHGDAQHCSDFNPYTKGLEIYACNEDQPGNNYRDATTSTIYHRFNSGNDDGRAMMGNFSDNFPGSIGCSAREGAISSVTYKAVDGMVTTGINTNFRIYWDGDLCSETFNYLNGKNTEGCVAKYGSWSPIYTCAGSLTNNDTKGTPCYQGDILGDWREEIIMRTANNNIRIYSTPVASEYRIPTLWSDHQYRNAMVWQMCGYNQPPHLSYFLGKLEGITQAPPPLTMKGREEVGNGGQIGASLNGKHVIVCETNDTEVSMAEGAQPSILTFNVPSWVQGTAGTNYTQKDATINYTYYTCNVTSGSLAGDARLVKQGDGILNLPAGTYSHTGETNVWAGTVNFDGSMDNSPLWLNRFAKLNGTASFKSIKTEYASVVSPGSKTQMGTVSAKESWTLGFGSRVIIKVDSLTQSCDQIVASHLIIESKSWTAGPKYLAPVFEISVPEGGVMGAGRYCIGKADSIQGSLANIKIEGIGKYKPALVYEEGYLYLNLGGVRGASHILWTGSVDGVWDYANTPNFAMVGDEEMTPEIFVSGDIVDFTDIASNRTVTIKDEMAVDTLVVNNTQSYIFKGEGFVKSGAFVKEGEGKVSIQNVNTYTGGNYLRGGTVIVSSLANAVQPAGNLGGVVASSAKFVLENGANLNTTADVQNGSPMMMRSSLGGIITNSKNFEQQKVVAGTLLTKKGAGNLSFSVSNSALGRLIVQTGTVSTSQQMAAKVVEMQGGTLNLNGDASGEVYIAEGKTATVNCNGDRSTYNFKLTGAGTVTIYYPLVKGSGWNASRAAMNGNWSEFEGMVKPTGVSGDGRFCLNNGTGMPLATLNIATGITVESTAKTFSIGKLTGAGNLGGVCSLSSSSPGSFSTWNVGSAGYCSFSGKVTGAAIFNKVGTEMMQVSGQWDNTGAVNVKEGSLYLSGKAQLGKGILNVAADAALRGTTSSALTNSSVTVNGIIQPGISESITTGTILFNNQVVSIPASGTLRLGINHASVGETDLSGCNIQNIATLRVDGTISLYCASNYDPQPGDEWRLWTGVNRFMGNPTITLDDYDVTFDTSRLAEEGVLVIESVATAINEAFAETIDPAAIYTISGLRVDQRPLPAGIYVKNGKKIVIK